MRYEPKNDEADKKYYIEGNSNHRNPTEQQRQWHEWMHRQRQQALEERRERQFPVTTAIGPGNRTWVMYTAPGTQPAIGAVQR
jgi:hypothetical protein